jgi:hypothetical protein
MHGTGATAGELLLKLLRFYYSFLLAGGGQVNSNARQQLIYRETISFKRSSFLAAVGLDAQR